MNYFVTAIHTDSGKTFVSSILCEALEADYWKPIQSGEEIRDAETVKKLISNPKIYIHPERFLLKTPCSPHQAAEIDQLKVSLSDFTLPQIKSQHLVIEGAGGILVPLNYDGDYVIDLAKKFEAEIVLVSNNYLGSINHTLLTIHELQRRWPYIKYIVFNGAPNPATESIILKHTGLTCLVKIPKIEHISQITVKEYADYVRKHWTF